MDIFYLFAMVRMILIARLLAWIVVVSVAFPLL
jgi:hypothetical protein